MNKAIIRLSDIEDRSILDAYFYSIEDDASRRDARSRVKTLQNRELRRLRNEKKRK